MTRADGNDLEDSYGLVHHNRTPKPALAAFEEMVNAAAPCVAATARSRAVAG